MTIQHLTPSDYITTKWSGGLTTQLGIAPAGAMPSWVVRPPDHLVVM